MFIILGLEHFVGSGELSWSWAWVYLVKGLLTVVMNAIFTQTPLLIILVSAIGRYLGKTPDLPKVILYLCLVLVGVQVSSDFTQGLWMLLMSFHLPVDEFTLFNPGTPQCLGCTPIPG